MSRPKIRVIGIVAAALALLATACGSSSASQAASTSAAHSVRAAVDRGAHSVRAAVDRAYRPVIETYDVPGMAVAVTVRGHRYFATYGLASKESNARVTKNTIFELGSVSKTFTATLASYAQATGAMSLGDHPATYLPQLRESAVDRASLLQLGTYTAGGLPLQFPDSVANDADMVPYFQQWQAEAVPGTQRRYSNPSVGLFGHIAGLAMGSSFEDVETRLFGQLGLRDTYLQVPESKMDRYAWGYTKDNTPIRVSPGVFDAEAYGVKTTAADMIGFVEDNLHPERRDRSMSRALNDTHVGYFRLGDMVQGLGWEQFSYPVTLPQLLTGNSDKVLYGTNPVTPVRSPLVPSRPTLFDKTGSTNGFGAYALFVPKKDIGIVMLANKSFPIPARVTAAYEVLEHLDKASRSPAK
jgi:beta-lactamase class C